MTDSLDLDAIEALQKYIAPIPWRLDGTRHVAGGGWPIWADDGDLVMYADPPGSHHLGTESAVAAVEAVNTLPALVAALRAAETKLAAIHQLAQLWTASDNVDDLHTRVTNRAYAGVLLDVLHREGEPT